MPCSIAVADLRYRSATSTVTPSISATVQLRQQFQNLLNDYDDIFAVDGQRPGRTSLIEHRIDLHPDTKPFKLPARRVPMHLQGEMDQENDSMLEQQIIEPSDSNFSSPPFLVRK